jgi:hypothetical protein
MTEWAHFISAELAKKRKRKRYRNDQAHREVVKGRARSRYEPKKAPVRKPRGRNKPRVIPVGDAFVVFVGLGQLADACGLSKQVIRRYEERGVIPINRLTDERGRRWYPMQFVEFLAPLLQGQTKRKELLRSLRSRVEQAWTEATSTGDMLVVEEQDAQD